MLNENSEFPILWDIAIVETESWRTSPWRESFLRLLIRAYRKEDNFSTIAYTRNENNGQNWTVMKTNIDFPNVLEISESTGKLFERKDNFEVRGKLVSHTLDYGCETLVTIRNGMGNNQPVSFCIWSQGGGFEGMDAPAFENFLNGIFKLAKK